jgi:Chaperone of endosialidase
MKTTTFPLRNSINWSRLQRALLLIPLAAACFALSPHVQAVDPPPDGGYPDFNTAEGTDSLFSLTDGSSNTAIGEQALYNNTGGTGNTAVGDHALFSNMLGGGNHAIGAYALYDNTTGSGNVAIGDLALVGNTIGDDNTAVGADTLESNTIGFGNTAIGVGVMAFNTIGGYNTAMGSNALAFNSTGSENTAIGDGALNKNTTGQNNIAIGKIAGYKITTGSNNIDIANQGATGNESNTIRIGNKTIQRNTYIAGISGVTVAGGVSVIVDTNGHLGTVTSSARYKENIQPMKEASEAILALEPVTFRYKHELDPDGIPQFGLVAEEVEKVNPDLVARDDQGKPYTVRYEAVNAMLLNEFLKEHQTVQELKEQVAELTAHLQKVSTQLGTGRVRVARRPDLH